MTTKSDAFVLDGLMTVLVQAAETAAKPKRARQASVPSPPAPPRRPPARAAA